MPCLRYARVSQREKFYEWDNEPLMVIVVPRLYVCLCVCLAFSGGAKSSVDVQFPSSCHYFLLFSAVLQAFSDNLLLLKGLLVLPTAFFVSACMCVTLHNVREVPGWTGARAAAGQMKN